PLPEPLTPTLYVTLTVVVAGCDSVTGNRNERVPLSPSMIEASPTLAVEVKDAWCMASVCAPPAETAIAFVKPPSSSGVSCSDVPPSPSWPEALRPHALKDPHNVRARAY